jgi:hypothetical protein
MIRLTCYPSINDAEKLMSHRKLMKSRIHRFKHGNWADIWEDQQKVKVGGDRVRHHVAMPEHDIPELLDSKAKKRARELAMDLELSKARKALNNQKLADPTDPEVFETLQELHQPQTQALPFPSLPIVFGGDDTQMKLRYKNWLVSQSQLGAGAQFKALPGPKKYKIEATTFQIMIQQFLMIK